MIRHQPRYSSLTTLLLLYTPPPLYPSSLTPLLLYTRPPLYPSSFKPLLLYTPPSLYPFCFTPLLLYTTLSLRASYFGLLLICTPFLLHPYFIKPRIFLPLKHHPFLIFINRLSELKFVHPLFSHFLIFVAVVLDRNIIFFLYFRRRSTRRTT